MTKNQVLLVLQSTNNLAGIRLCEIRSKVHNIHKVHNLHNGHKIHNLYNVHNVDFKQYFV